MSSNGICCGRSASTKFRRVSSRHPSSSRAGITTESFNRSLVSSSRRAPAGLHAPQVALHDLAYNPGQVVFHMPSREMRLNLSQIGDVANVVANAVGVLIFMPQGKSHPGQ